MTTPQTQNQMHLNAADMERLVDEHYANLYRFALSLVRNEPEAADLTQQTFFLLASRGGQIREAGKAKSWLFTTLYREFLALRRFAGRFTPMESDEAFADEGGQVDSDAVRQADAAIVMAALGRVRETFRVPLSLFYLEDLSYREIAEILEVPIGTVMSRLSRGKSELRAELESALNAESPPNVVPMNLPAAS